VRALRSRGRRGGVARLRYVVRDDSGFARQRVVVKRGGRRLKTISTGFAPADGRRSSAR
jgi:hypothetical protein